VLRWPAPDELKRSGYVFWRCPQQLPLGKNIGGVARHSVTWFYQTYFIAQVPAQRACGQRIVRAAQNEGVNSPGF